MKTIMADELLSLVSEIFQEVGGLSKEHSDAAADCLVFANLRGVDSHGVIRVPHYIKRLKNGSIKARPEHKVQKTAASTAMIDGDDGLGHPTTWEAMNLAIEMASETGVAFVGVNHSSHCGALSFYVSQAIKAGMIGFAFSQTDKRVTAFGGKQPFFGTNPLCIGAPSRKGCPVILDMATSLVAWGHVVKAQGLNTPVPDNWGLDEEGNVTTDPHKLTWLAPAAGPKGYGLGAIVEVLTGLLCGGAFGPHVTTMYGDYEQKRNLCHLVGVIDYRKFAGSEMFLDMMTTMVSEIHQVQPADGFSGVLAPGEPEYLKEQQRRESGIQIDDFIWNDLIALKG